MGGGGEELDGCGVCIILDVKGCFRFVHKYSKMENEKRTDKDMKEKDK